MYVRTSGLQFPTVLYFTTAHYLLLRISDKNVTAGKKVGIGRYDTSTIQYGTITVPEIENTIVPL